LLLELRSEHSLNRRLNILDQFINDRIGSNFNLSLLSFLSRFSIRFCVEANDDRVGSSCERSMDTIVYSGCDAIYGSNPP
jgi:hypothetical protein